MRKRHQAMMISSQAKKKICNELGLNTTSHEIEQKKLLTTYFNDNINEEDIEIISTPQKIPEKNQKKNSQDDDSDDEDIDDEDEEIITLSSNIKVPPLGDQRGPYIKYQISEKAFIGGINFDDYTYIPQNKINIKQENNNSLNNNSILAKNNNNKVGRYKYLNKVTEKKSKNENSDKENENISLNVGAKLNFNNIIEQMAYWSEEMSFEKAKAKDKNIKKVKEIEIPNINVLQLFKLYPSKMEEISEKLKELEKEAKNKNIFNEGSIVKSLLTDQQNIINEKKQDINKIAKELDRIQNITYGDNFSLIEFK